MISKGEVMQLMTEGQPETTIENYLQVISMSENTAVLFAAAVRNWARSFPGMRSLEESLREFGIYIGIAFQLVDDALDYAADQETLGKTVGDDFQEGKITLPVILAYNAGTREEKAFWTRTLSELEQKPGDFDEALALMHKHGAIGQTVTMAGEILCRRPASSPVRVLLPEK